MSEDAAFEGLEGEPKHIVDFLSSHLVTISYSSDVEPKPENGSACVLAYKGQTLLITAGHVIEDLNRMVDQKGFMVELFDAHGWKAKHPNPLILPYANLDRDSVGNNDDIDYGFIVLDGLTAAGLKANNVVAAEESYWQNPPEDEAHSFILIGTPGELCEYVGRRLHRVTSLMLPVKPTEDPPKILLKPNRRFYGTISLPEPIPGLPPVTRIGGMSGGPIFVLKKFQIDGKTRTKYWFWGIQSGWEPTSRTIAACGFAPFAELLVRALDEYLKQALEDRKSSRKKLDDGVS